MYSLFRSWPCCLLVTACCVAVGVSFLLEDPIVPCPNPATNCLNETFNRVLANLGCLGCQTGCQDGYMMTANPNYYVTEGDITGTYQYQNMTIPKSKNVSEPEWLCVQGDSCKWGYFPSKQGDIDECAYCGEGCSSCHGYGNCKHCVLGYRSRPTTLLGGGSASVCVSSGVLCPTSIAHCEHETYASTVVGCLGCLFCEDGFIPASNPLYRRAAENTTSGFYDYQGLRISGSLEINEPRYTCVKGPPCPPGWHNDTKAGFETCELNPVTQVVG